MAWVEALIFIATYVNTRTACPPHGMNSRPLPDSSSRRLNTEFDTRAELRRGQKTKASLGSRAFPYRSECGALWRPLQVSIFKLVEVRVSLRYKF